MGIFDTITRRLRPDPKPDPAAPIAPPPTLEELHELLDSAVAEEAAATALILSAPAQRDALLDQAGTDAAIRKLDKDTEGAHLLLERLGRITPELHSRIAAATIATRADAWAAMRSRLVEAISNTEAAMHAAESLFVETCALRLEAQRCGFTAEVAMLPYQVDVGRVNAEAMGQVRAAIAVQPLVAPPARARLWTVRFLAFTPVRLGLVDATAYQQGQEAGFLAHQAWGLVDAGQAEWADSKRRPPRPRKRTKAELTPATPPELVSMFGAGPVDPTESVRTGGRPVKREAA